MHETDAQSSTTTSSKASRYAEAPKPMPKTLLANLLKKVIAVETWEGQPEMRIFFDIGAQQDFEEAHRVLEKYHACMHWKQPDYTRMNPLCWNIEMKQGTVARSFMLHLPMLERDEHGALTGEESIELRTLKEMARHKEIRFFNYPAPGPKDKIPPGEPGLSDIEAVEAFLGDRCDLVRRHKIATAPATRGIC